MANLTSKIEAMKTNTEILFSLSLFVSILMALVSWFISRRLRSKEFMHLSEFWWSLASMTAISYIFHSSNMHVVGLGLLGWVWPLKTIFQVAEDLSGVELERRLKVIVLTLGACATLVMASYGFSFVVFTSGFCLSLGIVGGLLTAEIYKKIGDRDFSILGHMSFILLGLLFMVGFFYPVWRLSNWFDYGLAAQLMVLIGLGTSTVAFYMEVIKERQEKLCEHVLKERNEHFFGQSKYSELGMMSAGIAHEINNPLAIIQAKTTQLLRIHKDPKRIQEVTDGLEQILYTSERINRTIQGVRDFVHQDERASNEDFTVKNLIDDVLAFCGQRMKNHGINLRFYGAQNVSIHGHKIQLEQVLLNLLNNSFDAIEFLPDKWIEITTQETKDDIELYVKDSGSGIPPETASRMMEAFFTTKEVGKGTGLGLALARGIVEKHGGSLEYVGNTGHTTFLISLPKPSLFRPEPIRHKFEKGRSVIH
jgi:signal transduction histidine kinase